MAPGSSVTNAHEIVSRRRRCRPENKRSSRHLGHADGVNIRTQIHRARSIVRGLGAAERNNHEQNLLCGGGDHRPLGIARGAAERTERVSEHRQAFKVSSYLPIPLLVSPARPARNTTRSPHEPARPSLSVGTGTKLAAYEAIANSVPSLRRTAMARAD